MWLSLAKILKSLKILISTILLDLQYKFKNIVKWNLRLKEKNKKVP